jgi:1,2-phenylacetyl-CoA epoxidase PaaB subunit
MSKIREQIETSITEHDLEAPAERDLRAYVVFTQLKKDGPFIYAGWLDAPDDEIAKDYAKQHYGRDQQATAIWTVARENVIGTEPELSPRDDDSRSGAFQIFTQKVDGDSWISGETINANNPSEALETARSTVKNADQLHSIWGVPVDAIIRTADDELVWRYSDQSYRLARGYSKEVRDKWEQIRAEQDIEEYEKEDLKEAF